MNRTEFDTYLTYFNARDYDKAKAYFTDNLVLKFAGYTIAGKDAFSDFYAFFHQYVDEKVLIQQFAGDQENVIIDVVVRLQGKLSLGQATLTQKGYGRLIVLDEGEVKEIPQFIHYRIENGQFAEIRYVIKQ